MSSWHSPQSIYAVGHRAVRDLFTVPVQGQEKVDGSFFAFGLYPDDTGQLELKVRSKGAVMLTDAPEKMFTLPVKAAKDRASILHPGWMYRGEALVKPKHNALAYDRTTKDNVILFDILTDEETYLPYDELVAEGQRIGLEVVPQLYTGRINSAEDIRILLDNTSVLGGQKIEGVVLKPLEPLYGPDKKLLFSKFVSESYKEVHSQAWKAENPTAGDVLALLGIEYGTQTRWDKAIVHLAERGLLLNDVKDIGMLIREIPEDILKECEDEIKQKLFNWAWPHIRRAVTRNFPQYYKDRLMRAAFETGSDSPAERLGNRRSGGGDGPATQLIPSSLDRVVDGEARGQSVAGETTAKEG